MKGNIAASVMIELSYLSSALQNSSETVQNESKTSPDPGYFKGQSKTWYELETEK